MVGNWQQEGAGEASGGGGTGGEGVMEEDAGGESGEKHLGSLRRNGGDWVVWGGADTSVHVDSLSTVSTYVHDCAHARL